MKHLIYFNREKKILNQDLQDTWFLPWLDNEKKKLEEEMERMEWEMTLETKKNESDGAKESQSFFNLVENYVHKKLYFGSGHIYFAN